MADSRNIVVVASIAVAVLASGWAIYATKRQSPAGAMAPVASTAAPGTAGRPPGAPGPTPTAAGFAGAGMPVAVVTAVAQLERLATELSALGTARANEAVEITSKTSNLVTAVHFRDGDFVKRGTVLVELDSNQARADLAEAEAAHVESVSQVNRSRDLLATKIISEAQFEQLEATMKGNSARVAAARARLDDTVIRAPFDGRVGLRRVSVGSLVNPGTVITTLDDTSSIKVDFAVPENFLASLREGLNVTVTTAAFPDREFTGRVTSVDSRIDPVTRSVTVRAVLPNPQGLLKPGMFLNVRLMRDERDTLMIPEAALVPEQSRQFVFVIENDRAIRREVRIGRREPGRVEILAGLEAGDRVVVEGTQKIRDGVPVRELQQGISPPLTSMLYP
ncbi:MAG TPA: efflux RND transporter periplasmic adaptor subunit [Steroidobacteraceae bacterium]